MPKFNNQTVISMYVKNDYIRTGKEIESHTGNLWISQDGKRLMNYGTCLVERFDGQFLVNETKYSATTSKIQSYIRRELASHAAIALTRAVNNVPMWTRELHDQFETKGVK